MKLKSKSLQEIFRQIYPNEFYRTNRPQSNILELGHLLNDWKNIVGTAIAKNAIPQSVTKKILIVICKHNAYAYEYNFYAEDLLKKIYDFFPGLSTRIQQIKFIPHPTEFRFLSEQNNTKNICIESSSSTKKIITRKGVHPKSPEYTLLTAAAYKTFETTQDLTLRSHLIELYIQSIDEKGKIQLTSIVQYMQKNKLQFIEILKNFPHQVLLTEKSTNHSSRVLKVFSDQKDFQYEWNFYQIFKKKDCAIKVLGVDDINLILELEFAQKEKDIDIKKYSDLVYRMHVLSPFEDRDDFPSCHDWYHNFLVQSENAWWKDEEIVKAGLEIYPNIITKYPENYLLHGDLHQKNILLNIDTNQYLFIDPKGLIGPIIYELGAFIKNPDSKINKKEAIVFFSKIFNIESEDLKNISIYQTSLAYHWSMLENQKDRAKEFIDIFTQLSALTFL